MEIIEDDFKLIPINESSPFFDLELLKEVNSKKENARFEFKNAGYGLTLYSAIKRIIQYRIDRNHHKEAIDLRTYFQEYKKELDKFKQLL